MKKVTIQNDNVQSEMLDDVFDIEPQLPSNKDLISIIKLARGSLSNQHRLHNLHFDDIVEKKPIVEEDTQQLDEWKKELKMETGKTLNNLKEIRYNHLNSLKCTYQQPEIDMEIVNKIIRTPEQLSPLDQKFQHDQKELGSGIKSLEFIPKSNLKDIKRGNSFLMMLSQPSLNLHGITQQNIQSSPHQQQDKFQQQNYLDQSLKKIDYNQTFESLQRSLNKDIVNDLVVKRIKRAYTKGVDELDQKSKKEKDSSHSGSLIENEGSKKLIQQLNSSPDIQIKEQLKQITSEKILPTSNQKIIEQVERNPYFQDESNTSRPHRIFYTPNGEKVNNSSSPNDKRRMTNYQNKNNNVSNDDKFQFLEKKKKVEEMVKSEITKFSSHTLGSFKNLFTSFRRSSNLLDSKDIKRQLLQSINTPKGIIFSKDSRTEEPYEQLMKDKENSYLFKKTQTTLKNNYFKFEKQLKQCEINLLELREKKHQLTEKKALIAQQMSIIIKEATKIEKSDRKNSITRAILQQTKNKFMRLLTREKAPVKDSILFKPSSDQQIKLDQLKESKIATRQQLEKIEKELIENQILLKKSKDEKEVTRQMLKELYTDSLRSADLENKQTLVGIARSLLEIDEDISQQKEYLPHFLDNECLKYLVKQAEMENKLEKLEDKILQNGYASQNDEINKEYDENYLMNQQKYNLLEIKDKIQKMARKSILQIKKRQNSPAEVLEEYSTRSSECLENIIFSASQAPQGKKDLVEMNKQIRDEIIKIKATIINNKEKESKRLIDSYLSYREEEKVAELRQLLVLLFGEAEGQLLFKSFLKKMNSDIIQIQNSHTFTFKKQFSVKKIDIDQVDSFIRCTKQRNDHSSESYKSINLLEKNMNKLNIIKSSNILPEQTLTKFKQMKKLVLEKNDFLENSNHNNNSKKIKKIAKNDQNQIKSPPFKLSLSLVQTPLLTPRETMPQRRSSLSREIFSNFAPKRESQVEQRFSQTISENHGEKDGDDESYLKNSFGAKNKNSIKQQNNYGSNFITQQSFPYKKQSPDEIKREYGLTERLM